MSPHVVFPLILLLAAGISSAAPVARVGEAEVRETGNGLPCFTITEREEQRGVPNFQAVTVYDISTKPHTKMWAMAMPPDRTFPVLFSMCVPYGGRVQALPQTAASVLDTGKVYEVIIDARDSGGRKQAHAYSARFCLARQRSGSVAVRPIGARAQEGRDLFGCAPPKAGT
jgi:hypothetical protein